MNNKDYEKYELIKRAISYAGGRKMVAERLDVAIGTVSNYVTKRCVPKNKAIAICNMGDNIVDWKDLI